MQADDTQVKQVVACKAVIVRDGKILLMRESAAHDTNTKVDKYQFPGGRIEAGEPFLEGLNREIAEETGLTVRAGEPFFIGEWFPTVHGQKLHIVAIFFLCEDDGGEVRMSDEHDDLQWVDAKSMAKIDIMTPDDAVVRKYFATHAA